jgi:transcriptional regulator with GAF, ATPase, and Fis domain
MKGVDSTIKKGETRPMAARRRAAIIVHSPDEGAIGRRYDLDGTEHTFGRGGEGRGGVEDGRMSRVHARLRPSGTDGYSIEDLGSSNGTFLDGRRLDKPATALAGHVISMGETLLVIDQEPEPDRLPAAQDREPPQVPEIVGISFTTERLRKSIGTVAPTDGAVLLLGQTGVGKEVAARAIHRLSSRAQRAWVPVNCAAIPQDMAEAELFGYKRGAFTGATADHDGYFVQADGGTIFLDEIGDLAPSIQAKILRTLEDGSIQPIGASGPRRVDVRVLGATQVDLTKTAFRRDLFARLGDWVLELPSLAERRADILALWHHFQKAERSSPLPLSGTFAEALLLHGWPMNVREMQKLAKRVLALAGSNKILDLELLPESMRPASEPPKEVVAPQEREPAVESEETLPPEGDEDIKSRVQAFEARLIVDALKRAGWNQTAAAKALGMPLRTLVHKIKALGITKPT